MGNGLRRSAPKKRWRGLSARFIIGLAYLGIGLIIYIIAR